MCKMVSGILCRNSLRSGQLWTASLANVIRLTFKNVVYIGRSPVFMQGELF